MQIAMCASSLVSSVIGNKTEASVNWKSEPVNDTVCLISMVFVISIPVIGLDEKERSK